MAMYWLVIPVAWGISGPVVEKGVPTHRSSCGFLEHNVVSRSICC